MKKTASASAGKLKEPLIYCPDKKDRPDETIVFTHAFKLPSMEKFSSKKREVCPFEKFHRFVASKIGPTPEGKRISVGASWIGQHDAYALEKVVMKWLMGPHVMLKRRAEREYLWLNLDIGPACFWKEDRPEWVKDGYVYVRSYMMFEERPSFKEEG